MTPGPIAALSGGAFYVDTGGREAFKWLALRDADVQLGSAGQRRLYVGALIAFVIIGGLGITTAIIELS